jgi:nucleoside-diphosphate-sugar epimerase
MPDVDSGLNALTGKIIAVTGAGGFVGSSVVQALVQSGATVRALVGPRGVALYEPAAEVQCLRADIEDIAAIRLLISGTEIVVHLAGPAGVVASFQDPVEYSRVHVGGTAGLLDLCRSERVRRCVYISSAEVYGRPQTNPVPEDHPLQARSPYAAAKIGAESLVDAYSRTYGIESIILRPFSIYGARAPAQSLIATIVRQIREATPITLADLKPVRDYCYVEDVAQAVVNACVIEIAQLHRFNIGTGQGTSVSQLVELLLQLSGSSLMVRENDGLQRPRGAEIYELIADTRLARDILKWTPRFSLSSGLKETLESMSII